MSRSPAASYRGLPLPPSLRNVLGHPGVFLASVAGLVFMLAIKVFMVRGRPADRPEIDR